MSEIRSALAAHREGQESLREIREALQAIETYAAGTVHRDVRTDARQTLRIIQATAANAMNWLEDALSCFATGRIGLVNIGERLRQSTAESEVTP